MIRTLLLLLFGTTIVAMSIRSLRAERLKERHAILFVLTALPFLVLAAWPDGIVFMSEALTIEKATLMTGGLGAFTILLLIKLLSIVSVQDRRITTLTQVVTLLAERQGLTEPEIERLRSGVEPPEPSA